MNGTLAYLLATGYLQMDDLQEQLNTIAVKLMEVEAHKEAVRKMIQDLVTRLNEIANAL